MRVATFLCVLLGAGCSPGSTMGRPTDAAPADLAADLGSSGPDLAYAGQLYRFVLDQVRLPQMPTDYAFAPNHDGFPHNQFARVVNALFQKNVQLQPAVTVALTIDGTAVHLLTLGSVDANLLSDGNAFARIAVARAQKRPDLSGTGSFTVDFVEPRGTLAGELQAGTFVGADPAALPAAPKAPLRIPLGDTQTVTLPLVGAHVTFAASPTGLMRGELHGAITKADLDNLFIPALAANLTRIAQKPTCDADCQNVRTLFDYSPKDGTVAPDEVRGNPTLYPLLVPDVDLFDAKGAWAPNPKNTDADSFTIGIGFTAQKAIYAD